MTDVRVPWCVCRPSSGYSNARYRESGKLKDQWLCGDCWLPARAIFHNTIRWAAERIEWYGGTHDETETQAQAEVPVPRSEPPAELPEVGASAVTASHPPETVTVWGNDGEMLTTTESHVTTFPPPITGQQADDLPIDQFAASIREVNPHRSWDDCLRLAKTLADHVWAWESEAPRRGNYRECWECEHAWPTRAEFVADIREMERQIGYTGRGRDDLTFCPRCSHTF